MKKNIHRITIAVSVLITLAIILTSCTAKPTVNAEPTPLGKITDYKLSASPVPQKGKPAPDFQLQMPDSQIMMLSDLKGKAILLNFWQVNCPYCVKEMPYLEQTYRDFSSAGFALVAINVGESTTKVDNFLATRRFSFPNIMDFNITVSNIYNVRYLPTTYLIDKAGNIVDVKIGAFQNAGEIASAVKAILDR